VVLLLRKKEHEVLVCIARKKMGEKKSDNKVICNVKNMLLPKCAFGIVRHAYNFLHLTLPIQWPDPGSHYSIALCFLNMKPDCTSGDRTLMTEAK
jgi:hypothetical protein